MLLHSTAIPLSLYSLPFQPIMPGPASSAWNWQLTLELLEGCEAVACYQNAIKVNAKAKLQFRCTVMFQAGRERRMGGERE